MKHALAATLATLVVTHLGCSSVTGTKRLVLGASAGGAFGASGGAVLSPNSESRGLNALVFGLSGALIGGVLSVVTDSRSTRPSETAIGLKDQELRTTSQALKFEVQNSGDLPSFVRDRIKPVVVEEFIETDRVSEDGSLHEPHRVYRIRQSAELIARPLPLERVEEKGRE